MLKKTIIGIHHRENSFSKYWIEYCIEIGINYKIVDCYRSDIIDQLEECDYLMWHFNHRIESEVLLAKRVLFSVEFAGKKVFPNYHTSWHFDDKVGQKYLLESLEAPMPKSYVFYNKKEALDWVKKASYPKVFKLSGGAGSANVKLIRNKNQAKRIVKKVFGKGLQAYSKWDSLNDRIKKFQSGSGTFNGVLGGFYYLLSSYFSYNTECKEKGYFYVQDFVPNMDFDIRLVVVNDKAFGLKRMTRKGDFRASGSGEILYNENCFSNETVNIALEISKKMNAQCCAFDFVYDEFQNPLILEVSFGFSATAYFSCLGYWDRNLNFHKGSFNPYKWMVEELIKSID